MGKPLSRGGVGCALVAYAVSGWLTPLLLNELRMSGFLFQRGADSVWPDLFPMFSVTLAMVVAWRLAPQTSRGAVPLGTRLRAPKSSVLWRRLGAIALTDFLSGGGSRVRPLEALLSLY